MSIKKFGIKNLERRLGKLTIGEFIHTWRTSEEMSLKDFGQTISMSVSNLCDIEKGRKGVSPKKANQIALAIGVPPGLLVKMALDEELVEAGLKFTVKLEPTG